MIERLPYAKKVYELPAYSCTEAGGKADKDGSLTKYGYTPAPKKTLEHASRHEMETVSNKASRRSSCAAQTKDLRSRPSDLPTIRS